ncbi:MAG: hypothetical protein ACTTKD_07370 [Peptoanaerobacter stomatis]|uniref:hypothetical protein n=1 Tax=Peptoanaerobacter stomatis TaxID=796937 RepID=UPI003FA11BF6
MKHLQICMGNNYIRINEVISEGETLETLSNKHIFHQILAYCNKDYIDFTPLLMYALYKVDKIKYIVSVKNTGIEEKMTEETLYKFQQSKMKIEELNNYYEKTQDMFYNVSTSLIEKQERELIEFKNSLIKKERELNKFKKELSIKEKEINKRNSMCPSQKHSFLFGIAQSLIASFILMFVTIVFVLFRHQDKINKIWNILFNE